MITPDGKVITPASYGGRRYATRVRVATPQGSRYDGDRGTVVSVIDHAYGWATLMVELRPGLVLPFGLGEVEVIEERSRYQ